MLTENALSGLMKRRNYYDADTLFPFAPLLADINLGFVERCDLTRVSVLDMEVVSQLLSDHIGAAWMARELVRLRLETSMLKTVVERTSVPHFSSGLCPLKFHFLEPIMEDLGNIENMTLACAAPSMHFNLVKKQCYKTTCRDYSARMYDTLHSLSRALESVRREQSQIHRGSSGTSLLRKRKCVEGRGRSWCEMGCARHWSS